MHSTPVKKRALPAAIHAAIVDLPGSQEYYKAMVEAMEIHARKNVDYRGDNADVFYNFSQAAALANLTPRQIFRSEQAKKWSRLVVLQPGVEAQNEARQDTLLDLANYLMLELAYEETYPQLIDTVMTTAAFAVEFSQTVEQHIEAAQ